MGLLALCELQRIVVSTPPQQLVERRWSGRTDECAVFPVGTFFLYLSAGAYNDRHHFVLCPDGVIALIGHWNCIEVR